MLLLLLLCACVCVFGWLVACFFFYLLRPLFNFCFCNFLHTHAVAVVAVAATVVVIVIVVRWNIPRYLYVNSLKIIGPGAKSELFTVHSDFWLLFFRSATFCVRFDWTEFELNLLVARAEKALRICYMAACKRVYAHTQHRAPSTKHQASGTEPPKQNILHGSRLCLIIIVMHSPIRMHAPTLYSYCCHCRCIVVLSLLLLLLQVDGSVYYFNFTV